MITGTSLRPFGRIAFVGQMGAGKDTVAEALSYHEIFKLCSGIRQTVSLLRFYDSKRILYKFLKSIMISGNFYEELRGIIKHAESIPQTKKDRGILQYLGTSLRLLDDLIWVRYCLGEVRTSALKKVVITDVRRLVELNALRQEGFILFYIDAPYEVRLQRCVARDEVTHEEFLEASKHEAEREIESLKPLCDYVIDNSGESLEYAITQLYRIMKGRNSK